MTGVGFDELGLIKALLKRFFSDGPWTSMDASSLATAVGGAPDRTDRIVRHALAPDLHLVAGWVDDVFVLDVEVEQEAGATDGPSDDENPSRLDLSHTFDRGVVPEPTPNPRTIRFATGRRALAESTSYRRADTTQHSPAVAAVFAADDEVVDVLVASDFVAVSLRRPDRWPAALVSILDAVATGFAVAVEFDLPPADDRPVDPAVDVRGIATPPPHGAAAEPTAARRQTRLDRAWADLADVDATTPDGLARLRTAAAGDDTAHRQVAAQLLDRAQLDDALPLWDQLLTDPSRTVRRTALDAATNAEDERLRPLLERALADTDPWMRWKALHGLVVLGITPSLDAIAHLDDDPDFRVRLEATNARRHRGS
jgi:hypothetical protein